VFGSSLSKLDHSIWSGELIPKHGSGATADRLIGNDKWQFTEWTERLETLFPFLEYGLPNARSWSILHPDNDEYDEYLDVRFLSPEEERPVKQVAVPKTKSTPRLIAEEPTCMQYMQQAIMVPLVRELESGALSKHFVGFTQQWPNQAMAQIGSEDRSLATLDLSEASDRVGNWIVEELFSDFPWFLEAIQATRSTRIQLIGGEVVPINKFASMGSALTFPIEAMVFTAIALEAVLRASRETVTKKALSRLRDMVRVYGDDIIVPTHSAELVIESLEAFGLKVNRHKSFWNGEFRESCGKEYWKGQDVSIVRFRKAAPSSRHDVENIVSWVKTRNLFQEVGDYPCTVNSLDDILEALLGHFPYVAPTSVLLGRTHPNGFYQVDRVSGRYQSSLTKGWSVRSKLRKQPLDGHAALLKCLLVTIGLQDTDEEHLQRGGRPLDVSITLGMGRPY
jgi:hypothetical protein